MELETLIVALTADISQFKSGLAEAEKAAGGSSSNIASNWDKGTKALGGMAVAGFGALVGAGVSSINMASEWNGKLDEVMDKTGATSAEAAGLVSMQERLGGSTEDLSKMLVFMGKDAEKVDGTLASLGITTRDSAGNMLSSGEIFQSTADYFAQMPDGIEKSNLMMQIFGKNGSEAGDLLSEAANGGLQEYITRAEDLGLATDPEKAIEFEKAQMDLNQTLQGLAVSIGTELMPVLTPLITQMADLAQQYLPPLVGFISDNFIPILGVLALAFLIWAINAGIAAIATIGALWPVILVIGIIMLVVGLLVAAWKNDWGGIRTFMTDLWDNKLKPIFEAVKEWFQTNIPKALEALKTFWENKIMPVVDGIKGAFDGIGKAIEGVIDWVEDLIEKFKNIEIPDWLTPGSPTPFEMGLRGITSAMKTMNRTALPEFTAQMSMNGVTNPTTGSRFSSGNSEVVSMLDDIRNKKEIDIDELALKIRDAVVMAVG